MSEQLLSFFTSIDEIVKYIDQHQMHQTDSGAANPIDDSFGLNELWYQQIQIYLEAFEQNLLQEM